MAIILKSEDLERIITIRTLHTNVRESVDTYSNRQDKDQNNQLESRQAADKREVDGNQNTS